MLNMFARHEYIKLFLIQQKLVALYEVLHRHYSDL